MNKVKIIFTQDVMISLVKEKEPLAISEGTIMFVDNLVNKTLGSFANITDKDVNYKKDLAIPAKVDVKKAIPAKVDVKK